ncbi:MAG: hypothetical protein HWE27_15960 [Gammaproteobacteria bacterium]|nr:hypothetical protein [Gammaproteobacteria bacterium]
MKIKFAVLFTLVLTGCVSSELRILDFQSRCELIGFDRESKEGKACVLELEKEYVSAVNQPKSGDGKNFKSSNINELPSVNRNSCLFNPSNNRYETCFHVTAGGSCAHFGSACTP